MSENFPVEERLKSKKLIEKIFLEGTNLSKYPLKVFYTELPAENNLIMQAGFSVSKRKFKRAVDRNRIKRLMREAYRLKKTVLFNNLSTSYAFMFLYIGKDKPDFRMIKKTMEQLLLKFLTKQSDHEIN